MLSELHLTSVLWNEILIFHLIDKQLVELYLALLEKSLNYRDQVFSFSLIFLLFLYHTRVWQTNTDSNDLLSKHKQRLVVSQKTSKRPSIRSILGVKILRREVISRTKKGNITSKISRTGPRKNFQPKTSNLWWSRGYSMNEDFSEKERRKIFIPNQWSIKRVLIFMGCHEENNLLW